MHRQNFQKEIDFLIAPMNRPHFLSSFQWGQLTNMVGNRPIDFLFYWPVKLNICNFVEDFSMLKEHTYVKISGKVILHEASSRVHRIWITSKKCNGDKIALQFFKRNKQYLKIQFALHKEITVVGMVEKYGMHFVINHPKLSNKPLTEPIDGERMLEDERSSTETTYQTTSEIALGKKSNYYDTNKNKITPVYKLCAGITSDIISSIVKDILRTVKGPDEWLPKAILDKLGLVSWIDSLRMIHNPTMANEVHESVYRDRIILEELICQKFSNLQVKKAINKTSPLCINGPLRKSLKLPFELTNAQKNAIEEIDNDLASNQSMVRMLQGDVGSGKTIVALHAMLACVDSGAQAALVAPTQMLAMQHYQSLSQIIPNVRCGIFCKQPGVQLYRDLANGFINIAIGTHCLMYDKAVFKNLRFVVIDEQHRFGVKQRMSIIQKAQSIDMLAMSATPIPRSLLLAIYGEMSLSELNEKPQNRGKIVTISMHQSKIDEIIEKIHDWTQNHRKIYWVCPVIEEHDAYSASEARYKQLHAKGFLVDIVHGKTKNKDLPLEAFKKGTINILVCTTVIEVGIDVPDASIMIIENVERFGLSQLHQLRGRIGRGSIDSLCILLYDKLTYNAKIRIDAMKKSNDGFYLAKVDLDLRGPGDVLGVKQTGKDCWRFGMPSNKIVNIINGMKEINCPEHILLIYDKNSELVHAG